MKFSIVSTLYQSSRYLREFHRRISGCAALFVGDSYEIILVNDGSPDDSLEIAVELHRTHPQTIVVDLSRNFGHHKAMMTGLAHARGDFIFLIDSDLEEEPEWLESFHAMLAQNQADVVFGVQRARKGKWFERISGLWFYRFFQFATDIKLPANIVTARLMTRRYVQALLEHREREVFLAGIWHITGFKQLAMEVDKLSASETTYTFRRKMALLVNSVTSFSNKPLKAIFYVGILISVADFVYIIYLLRHWWVTDAVPSGWTSVMASIWFLGGLIISFMGVIGIYLSKIFSEVKQRPYSIVRQVYGKSEE